MDTLNKPLVTVAILVYNNYQYLKECLDSILEQSYENIQLIISDDGSEGFNARKVESYIQKKMRANIKSYFVYTMENNIGTSRNFNFTLKLAEGKYIKYIAADDLFYDVFSLSDLVTAAENEKSSVVIARAPNYDMYLERQEWTYPSDAHWEQMKDAAQNPKMFFGMMSQFCLISAPSVLMNREFLMEHGGADERYRLIEDWPLWMKMLRSGEMFTFLNKPVVIYRSGGVSNGKKNAAYAVHQIEYADVIRNECLAYPDFMATEHQFKLAKESERQHRFNGERLLLRKESLVKKLGFFFCYFDLYFKKLWEKGSQLFWRYQSYKRELFVVGIIMLTLSIITDISSLFGPGLAIVIRELGMVLGWASLLISFIIYLVMLPLRLCKLLKNKSGV